MAIFQNYGCSFHLYLDIPDSRHYLTIIDEKGNSVALTKEQFEWIINTYNQYDEIKE